MKTRIFAAPAVKGLMDIERFLLSKGNVLDDENMLKKKYYCGWGNQ